MAGREAHVAVQPRDGPPDPVVVGQRLPHPHEDDVGDPPGRPGLPHGDGNLLDDFALGQLPLEPGLTGGAELATHGAAGLGGHADGHPVRVVHEDRLDLGPVVERPEPLGRLAGVGRLPGHLAQSGGSASARVLRRAAGSSVMSSGRCARRWRPSQTWRTR